MFGYRVQFNRENLVFNQPFPAESQSSKPIHKFTTEIVDELTKGYEVIPKYHTIQKVIIPVQSSSESSEAEVDENEVDGIQTEQEVAE